MAAGLSPAPGASGPGVFGEIEKLADDQVAGVVDDVAIQVQDLVGPARVAQGVAGDGPERIVLADLVDGPGHGVAAVDLGLGVAIGPAACSRRSVAAAGQLGRGVGDGQVQLDVQPAGAADGHTAAGGGVGLAAGRGRIGARGGGIVGLAVVPDRISPSGRLELEPGRVPGGSI